MEELLAATTSESTVRAVLLGYFPMFIATLSLLTSIYNGYLNSRFLDIIQLNVGRTEYMRTCKEIIEAYFTVKVRVGALHALGDRAASTEQLEARQRGGEVRRARHLFGQPAR